MNTNLEQQIFKFFSNWRTAYYLFLWTTGYVRAWLSKKCLHSYHQCTLVHCLIYTSHVATRFAWSLIQRQHWRRFFKEKDLSLMYLLSNQFNIILKFLTHKLKAYEHASSSSPFCQFRKEKTYFALWLALSPTNTCLQKLKLQVIPKWRQKC